MKLKVTKKRVVFAISFILLVTLALAGTIMSQVDEPKYNVIYSQSNIEIREYAPMLIAQVEVVGERKSAISLGFRMLADYIFGNNKSVSKIGMTAPVSQQQRERISMTAPVIQQELDTHKHWIVRFVMPSAYTLETLPRPNNSQIQIVSLSAKRYAIIRFSGLATESALKKYQEDIDNFIEKEKLDTIGNRILAFYNPPWTLPFLRRNEIMFELQ